MKTKLKTFLSFLLIVSLICPTLCFAYAKTPDDEPLSVYVASDIHYRPYASLVPLNEQNALPGDKLYYHANSKSMLTYEADAIIDEFLNRFENSSAQFLLIPGDMSEDGYWEEHLSFAQKLRDFQKRTGKTIFVIPGNHDIRTSKSSGRLELSDFLEIYSDIGYDKALSRHEGSASYTAELCGNYRLLAVDACVYRQDGSAVSDELYSWIEEQVRQASADGKKLVAMVHHNILKHFEIESVGGNQLCLDSYKDLASVFADWGIKYVFTGHEHANDISSAVSKNGNRIFDIETGSLITYPNAYRVISFSEKSVDIKTEYVDKIDTSLLPDGFTEEQLKLMSDDFSAYSYGYFRAGMRSLSYYIPNYTGKVSKLLKIEKGTKAYEALEEVMEILSEALRMPLYDKEGSSEADSVSELAESAGISLPESEYTDIIDVAAVIYAGHYAGDESIGYDSDETELLFAGLEAILVYSLVNIPVRTANILLEELLPANSGLEVSDRITELTAKTVYMKTAAKIILREYIRPVANGIVNDLSSPGDLNVKLEPYGRTQFLPGKTVAVTDFSNILHIITELFCAFCRTVKAFFAP